MSSLISCINKHCPPGSRDAVLKSISEQRDGHLADGASALEARRAAINDTLKEFQTARASVMAQVEQVLGPTQKSDTNLKTILDQVKNADGLTGKLGKFVSEFIPRSKLDIKVIIDPNANSAGYSSGAANLITLRDPSQLLISLHEITHAVTVREMEANKAVKNQVKSLMLKVKAKAIKEAIITPAQMKLLETETTSLGYKENIRSNFKFGDVAYGLLNEKEFLAQAMGSSQFQQLLKATTITDKGQLRTAWDAFVSLVMKTLGIEQAHKNAFGEALTIVAKLASQENVALLGGNVYESLDEATGALFSQTSANLHNSASKISKIAEILASPKNKLHDLYVQYAPQWLSVTPLTTLVQTFGKTIPQIRMFSKALGSIVNIKTELVDTSAVLYDKAEELAKKTVGVDAFNRAAAIASFNRMTPWLELYEQDWIPSGGPIVSQLEGANKAWANAGMRKATGLSFTAAYAEAKKAYNALGSQELKDAYQKIVEHINSVRVRERNNLLAYIEQVSEEGSEARQQLMDKFNASFSNLFGAYWPLERNGDFILEYTDGNGFRVVRQFETIAERNEAKNTILDEGIDPTTIKEDFKNKQAPGAIGIPRELMDQLSKAVQEKYLSGIDGTNQEAIDAANEKAQSTINDMTQIWLRWTPETSALKNSIRRKNVKGFSTDMLRSYLNYMQRHASSIAWTEQGKEIDNIIQSFSGELTEQKQGEGPVNTDMQRHILNDLRNRVQALKSTSVGFTASSLGKLSTAWYMTSPSIALVQMSQLGVLTYPKLLSMYGAKATTALAKGIKDAFSTKYTREPMFADLEVNTVYENMRMVVTDENRDTPQAQWKELGERMYYEEEILEQIRRLNPEQVRLLALREAMARNLLDISAAHEAYEIARGNDPKNIQSKIFKLALLPMSLSELASRKATVLASFELARAKGDDFFKAMDAVDEVVTDTLHSYAKENKGSALQGGLPRVLLQFQHYRIMTGIRLALLLRNTIKGETPDIRKAATKEFVGIMGMTGALAGTVGLPMTSAIMGIMSMLLGDEDEPYDAELAFNNWLNENFGKTTAELVTKGLPTLVGADLSRRLGMGDLYGSQAQPPANLHGKDLAAWWAASQLGPTFSVAQGFIQGYDEIINKGNYLRGLEDATPKPIKDVLKSIRIASNGLENRAGKKLLADDNISAYDVAMLAIGFNPEEIAKAQETEQDLTKLSVKISERRSRLISDASKAIVEGGDTSSELGAIRTFNSKMPLFAITGKDIMPAVRKIVIGELGTTGVRQTLIAKQYEVPVYRGF